MNIDKMDLPAFIYEKNMRKALYRVRAGATHNLYKASLELCVRRIDYIAGEILWRCGGNVQELLFLKPEAKRYVDPSLLKVWGFLAEALTDNGKVYRLKDRHIEVAALFTDAVKEGREEYKIFAQKFAAKASQSKAPSLPSLHWTGRPRTNEHTMH
jgi:hypothetical protein